MLARGAGARRDSDRRRARRAGAGPARALAHELRLVAAAGVMGADLAAGTRFGRSVLAAGPGGRRGARPPPTPAPPPPSSSAVERRPDPLRRRRRHGARHPRRRRRAGADPRHPDRRQDALRRVFASTPESAGDVAAAFLAVAAARRVARGRGRRHRRGRSAGGHDLDAALRGRAACPTTGCGAGREARAPCRPTRPRSTLSARAVADAIDPRRIYVLGPGTTTRRVMRHLGLPKTLLGIDAVRAGRLLGADLGERELLALIGRRAGDARRRRRRRAGRAARPRQPAAQPGCAAPHRRRATSRSSPACASSSQLDPPCSTSTPAIRSSTGSSAATAASTSRRGRTLVYRVAA